MSTVCIMLYTEYGMYVWENIYEERKYVYINNNVINIQEKYMTWKYGIYVNNFYICGELYM